MDSISEYSVPNVSKHLMGAVDDRHHNLSVATLKSDARCKRKLKVTDGPFDHPGASLFLAGYSADGIEEGSV